MTKTLIPATDNFDQVNTFRIAEVPYSRCSLRCGYQKKGDGVFWALLRASVLKPVYTDADIAERDRLASGASTIAHGEVVEIEGRQYRTRVLGKFSDCAVFDAI